MSSEESNKMSKKIPSQDSNSDEIEWDFETNDINETFRYQFTEELGWEDVRRFEVTLEVTDSQGRTNYDNKSVQITLSLKNHPPEDESRGRYYHQM